MRTGTIKLNSGIGKTSGKAYTNLHLNVGKWNAYHFPTSFEADYLTEYLKDGKEGVISLSKTDQHIHLQAGEYVHEYKVESVLEYKYIRSFLQDVESKTDTNTNPNDTLDLTQEDPIQNGFTL